MEKLLIIFYIYFVGANSQYFRRPYLPSLGGYEYQEAADESYGHGDLSTYGDVDEEDYAAYGQHTASNHRAYGGQVAQHGSHQKHHDKSYYERNQDYGYEKAYGYDKIKASHDKGASHFTHGHKHAHHGSEGIRRLADESTHGHSQFVNRGQYGGQSFPNREKFYGNQGSYHHSHGSRGHQGAYVLPYPGYEAPISHTVPIYGGPEHLGYVH